LFAARSNKIVEENVAVTKQMTDSSVHVLRSIENVGSVAEENSASAQEVSASTEEMSAQVEEVLASAQSLTEMSEAMERAVAVFKIDL
jgi:methyl-accepting chemotaxis protein